MSDHKLFTLRPQSGQVTSNENDIQKALATIDDLRARIASGEYKAFFAVALKPDHSTSSWSANITGCTTLEATGAIFSLLHNTHHGHLDEK